MGVFVPNFQVCTEYRSKGQDFFRVHLELPVGSEREVDALRRSLEGADWGPARELLRDIALRHFRQEGGPADPRTLGIIEQVRSSAEIAGKGT